MAGKAVHTQRVTEKYLLPSLTALSTHLTQVNESNRVLKHSIC